MFPPRDWGSILWGLGRAHGGRGSCRWPAFPGVPPRACPPASGEFAQSSEPHVLMPFLDSRVDAGP